MNWQCKIGWHKWEREPIICEACQRVEYIMAVCERCGREEKQFVDPHVPGIHFYEIVNSGG